MSRQEQSLQRIQQASRGYLTRKKLMRQKLNFLSYALPEKERTNYPALFAGNGPNPEGIVFDKIMRQPFVMVGVCCFQTIKFASSLCENNNIDLLKRIIILDNSANVIKFWHYMQSLFSSVNTPVQLELMLRETEVIWQSFGKGYADYNINLPFSEKFLPFQFSFDRFNVFQFYALIETLLDSIGFAHLKRLVCSAIVLPCDLTKTDTQLFDEITHWCERQGLSRAVYVSNVFALSGIDAGDSIDKTNRLLCNLNRLNPLVSVYLSLSFLLPMKTLPINTEFGFPGQLFCFQGVPEACFLQNKISWRSALLEKLEKSIKYVALDSDLQNLLAEFCKQSYAQSAKLAMHIHHEYERVMSPGNMGEAFILHTIIGRLLGISLIKSGDVLGAKYLDICADFMRKVEGDSSVVQGMVEENKRLIGELSVASPLHA